MGTTPVSKDGLLGQIWSISTTLTPEAMAAASKKCSELGFDANRGIVSLEESFTNLSSARATLEDAIEKQKLVQLPITVQRELLSNLEAISRSLTGLSAGTDEVANLATAIEALNTSIWKYGFHNLSDQVLGYQKKLNQLKNQELEIGRIIAQLGPAHQLVANAAAAAEETGQKATEAARLLGEIKAAETTAASSQEQAKNIQTQAGAALTAISQNEKQSGELAASIKTAHNELRALDASIRKFYEEVDAYRNKITQTNEEASSLISASHAAVKKLVEDTTATLQAELASTRAASAASTKEQVDKIDVQTEENAAELSKLRQDLKAEILSLETRVTGDLVATLKTTGEEAEKLIKDSQQKMVSLEAHMQERSDATIEANNAKSSSLLDELDKLKGEIHEQIEQATGFTLFGAFQARQNEIARSKNLWVWAIGALVLVSAIITIWIAHEAQYYTVNSFAFYVKLSLTIPLAFAITFCTVQYNRERRLEEEYAFKSSISVSLNPYRELVFSLLSKGEKPDLTKYTEFVIASVTNVFTPPTDRVFETEKHGGITQKTMKQTAELLGTVINAAKSK